jgi:hypothetical protein
MDRRRFLLTSLGAFAALLAAEAQDAGKVYRIGLLSPYSSAESVSWHRAFRRGLRDLGWIEGQNITIEPRYANGRNDRLPELVAELVGLKVDIIVTAVTPDTLAAKKGTYHPDRDGLAGRSCGHRHRHEPGAARRKHHGAVADRPRSGGQTG